MEFLAFITVSLIAAGLICFAYTKMSSKNFIYYSYHEDVTEAEILEMEERLKGRDDLRRRR